MPAEPAGKSQVPSRKDTHTRRGILTRTTRADQGFVELPALAPHLQFRDIGEQQTLLVSESFNTLLHGRLYRELLPLVDGRRPRDEIVAALAGAHAATDVLGAIFSLSAKGYVVSAEHGMDPRRAAYWSSLGASPRWVEQRLAQASIAVEGDDGRVDTAPGGVRRPGGSCNAQAHGHRLRRLSRSTARGGEPAPARGGRAVDAGAAARHRGAVRPRLSRGRTGTLLGLSGLPPAQPPGGPQLPAQRRRRGGRVQAVCGGGRPSSKRSTD